MIDLDQIRIFGLIIAEDFRAVVGAAIVDANNFVIAESLIDETVKASA